MKSLEYAGCDAKCARRGLCCLFAADRVVLVALAQTTPSMSIVGFTPVISENVAPMTLVSAAAVHNEVAYNPQATAVDFPTKGVITSAIAS
jgi:hypothetical protein